ncbi:MAG: type IV secretion system protein VirB10 [Nevskia sp.]|nr:type IV secretion system protein VirB10 [Nevskia sp.]
MCPADRDPPPNEPAPEPESQRRRGASPVVKGTRSKIGMMAGFLGLMLVVAFLFLTGGNNKLKPAAKPLVAAAPAAGLPPGLADGPPLPPDNTQSSFEVPNNPQHFESGGGRTEAAEAERQKAEARLHSPMLIYDSSGHEEPAPQAKTASPDPMAALLESQIQGANAAAAAGAADDHAKRSTPAEGYAERTQAFAHAASDEQIPEATARHISMDNRIAQGKMVPGILETAINSDLPGKLRAIISQDVWSEDGSRRLIRRGSRLAGEYRSGLVRGQTRVFVIWTRVLQPDGTDVAIGSPGTDDIGRAGLTGAIDRHFVERFGAAFLLSLIGSATTASQGGNTFVVNTSQGFGQVAQESLQDSINIPPTIYVDQGTPVQVFVARDLIFDQVPVAMNGR